MQFCKFPFATHIESPLFPDIIFIILAIPSANNFSNESIECECECVCVRDCHKMVTASVLRLLGGCGAMYEVHIESNEFKGKRIIQQHQQVNQVKPS